MSPFDTSTTVISLLSMPTGIRDDRVKPSTAFPWFGSQKEWLTSAFGVGVDAEAEKQKREKNRRLEELAARREVERAAEGKANGPLHLPIVGFQKYTSACSQAALNRPVEALDLLLQALDVHADISSANDAIAKDEDDFGNLDLSEAQKVEVRQRFQLLHSQIRQLVGEILMLQIRTSMTDAEYWNLERQAQWTDLLDIRIPQPPILSSIGPKKALVGNDLYHMSIHEIEIASALLNKLWKELLQLPSPTDAEGAILSQASQHLITVECLLSTLVGFGLMAQCDSSDSKLNAAKMNHAVVRYEAAKSLIQDVSCKSPESADAASLDSMPSCTQEKMARIFMDVGSIHYSQGKYDMALKEYLQAYGIVVRKSSTSTHNQMLKSLRRRIQLCRSAKGPSHRALGQRAFWSDRNVIDRKSVV